MKGSTLLLKLALVIVGAPVLVLCIIGLFWLVNNTVNPDYAPILYPILIGVYLSAIPFYIAFYKAYRLLTYIDGNDAFSQISVKALRDIKGCAITFSSLYVVILPFVYLVAEKDDAPGLLLIGILPIFASLVITVFAAVLQKTVTGSN